MISASVRRLAVFKTVVETEKFSSAAAALDIAQASVSAHIKALEREVGRPLFLRGPGRPPRLTEAGEAMYVYAKDALDRAREAEQALEAIERTEPEKIVLAFQHGVNPERVPERLASFAQRFPKIKVIARRVRADELLSLLDQDRIDLGFLFGSGPIPGFHSDVIGESDERLFVVAPTHPLASRRGVAAKELAQHRFVTPLADSYFYHLFDLSMRRVGIKHYDIAMEASDGDTLHDLCVQGMGIVCAFRGGVEADLKSGALVAIDTVCTLPRLEVRWAAPRQRPVSATAMRFLQHLKPAMRSAAQTGD